MSQTPHSAPAPSAPIPLEERQAMVEAFAVGRVLDGKYKISRVIGQGGLGVVVAAVHQQLDQRVAIKHLKPIALSRPIAVERFLREAKLAARVQSDHVARVFDVERTDLGCPYIVMEYLEGTDLGDLLGSETKVPIERAVDYVLQACEALAEAHALGIIHRDLKPENLFLAKKPGGQAVIKILDFGISKLSEKQAHASGVRPSKLTSERETFGTPNYMSPEQLQSASDVDARSDIWALGVILYELVSGVLPFDDVDLPQLCLSIVNKPAPPFAPDLGVPAGLARAIFKCLEKERPDRYRNVGELAQDLGAHAAPASLARVEHVRQVVLESGEAVRPPRQELASATPTQAVSNAAVAMSLPGRARTPLGLVGLAALCLVVGFVGVLALVRKPLHPDASSAAAPSDLATARSDSTSRTAQSAQSAQGASVPSAPAMAAASPEPPATTSAVAPSPPPTTASPARYPTPASAKRAAQTTARPAASVDVSAKKHAEFGDRQ